MLVTIHTRAILEKIPELVPAFREYADDIPEHIEMEAALTASAQKECDARDKYPKYWEAFTGIEWLVFVQLLEKDGGNRNALKVVFGAEAVSISDDDFLTSNVIDVHMKNLRKKLYALGNEHHIRTKRGWGYILVEGPNVEDAYVQKREYRLEEVQMAKKPKKLDSEGRTVRPHWRPHSNRLNPIEFGYLKEMKMDDIAKEMAAKRLSLSLEEIEHPWEAPNFAAYVKRFKPLRSR